jgi:cytochrome c
MSMIHAIRPLALVAVLAVPAAYADDVKGDAANGKELFMANTCPTCHSVTKDDSTLTVGPNLVGVVGRKAGTTVSLMGPSEGLKKYGVTWSAQTLNEFLTDPNAKVPGTAMIGILPDPQQRADVIAFLSTLRK